jgi:glycosyltransferase involved in cell wall biosynthesis
MLAALDNRRKGQDNLVKALSAKKWKNRNWQLYLYGSGESEQQLKSLVIDTNMSDKIFFKGHTTDVKGALAEAHLLLQMTHIDAMPLAVMEAIAMARPLVVSNVGDMPEWVTENVNGWISSDASVEAIDETLEKCWQNKDRWEKMGKNSYRIFKEKFPAIPEEFLLKQLSS